MSFDNRNLSALASISKKPKLWAVLVGVNLYQDDTISNLHYCANDCQELAEVLTIASQIYQTEIIAGASHFGK